MQSFDASSPYRSAVLPSFLVSLLVQDGGLVTCGSPQVTQSFQYYRIFRLIFRSFVGFLEVKLEIFLRNPGRTFYAIFSGFLWLTLFGSN